MSKMEPQTSATEERAQEMAIVGAARRVRNRVQSPRERAEVDQSAESFVSAYATLGLDLHDPAIAAGAHALVQILHYRMVDECKAIEVLSTPLLHMGAHIQEALAATAMFLS